MFDDLFLSSVKQPDYIDVSDVKERKFTDYLKKNLLPSEEKEIRFFNDKSLLSDESKSDKFTNFISDKTDSLIIERLATFLSDVSMLADLPASEVSFNQHNSSRVLNIIKMYIPDLDIDALEEDSIMKAPIISNLNTNENVRVYFMMDPRVKAYEIILFDPYHLVIPSKFKKKNAKQMMEETYTKHKGNQICISSIMKPKAED